MFNLKHIDKKTIKFVEEKNPVEWQIKVEKGTTEDLSKAAERFCNILNRPRKSKFND